MYLNYYTSLYIFILLRYSPYVFKLLRCSLYVFKLLRYSLYLFKLLYCSKNKMTVCSILYTMVK